MTLDQFNAIRAKRRVKAQREARERRESATVNLRWVVAYVVNARLKDESGDASARFDWQRAWDHMARRLGVES
jgi:hypothetical protein